MSFERDQQKDHWKTKNSQWFSIENIRNRLGFRIMMHRNELKLSQDQFARLCGLDRSYISGVERGKRNISIENLAKIAQALELPLSELLRDF